MKTKNGRFLLLAVLTVFSFGSCKDWGESDPPAGGQIYPKLEKVVKVTFDNEAECDSLYWLKAVNDGATPIVADNTELQSKVLNVNGGYANMPNPLNAVKVQKAVSLTFWMQQELTADAQDVLNPIFSFENENGSSLLTFSANGGLKYNGVSGTYNANDSEATGIITAGVWHYVGVCISESGYSVYVDGEEALTKNETNFNFSEIVQFAAQTSELNIGDKSGMQTCNLLFDDITVYRNAITSKEWSVPAIGGGSGSVPFYAPIYFNSFDGGAGDCTIVGAGTIEVDGAVHGKVFSNATGGTRANYLKLPSTALSQSAETKELSLGVWVNRGNETTSSAYMWCPLFAAYGDAPVNGENTFPVFIGQYRGLLQVNCNGWCDFTDAQNVAGANVLYHDATDWLADGGWHYYTATLTETSCKVYIDGEIANEWEITGVGDGNSISGLFSNGSELDYICLGGNQAWTWGDPDPGFYFDDIAIYNQAISQEQIKSIIKLKENAVYLNTFEPGAGTASIVGGGSIEDKAGKHGNIFSNATGGTRANYLKLPSTAFSQSAETKELSLGVWVNRGNETTSSAYMWCPLFAAYGDAPVNGENTFPVFIGQYRGLLQVNCNGWCDFTDAQNVAGANVLYHDATDWLSDGGWHYYTATLTETSCKVYIDGEIANEWEITGVGDGNSISGLFSNGSELDYICLGGNQAWTWGDPDPGFYFDDIAIYNTALTQDEIKSILVAGKK